MQAKEKVLAQIGRVDGLKNTDLPQRNDNNGTYRCVNSADTV